MPVQLQTIRDDSAIRSSTRQHRCTASIRLIGAVLLEANDEWQLQHRYMQTEAMAELTPPTIDAAPTEIATIAAWPMAASLYRSLHHLDEVDGQLDTLREDSDLASYAAQSLGVFQEQPADVVLRVAPEAARGQVLDVPILRKRWGRSRTGRCWCAFAQAERWRCAGTCSPGEQRSA